MSFHVKKRIVIIVLGILTVWPSVHYLVVQKTGLDPWKGFGWAMYCVPVPLFYVQVKSLDPPGQIPLTRVQQAQNDFIKWRTLADAYAKPNGFAEKIFEAYPNVATIEITVLRGGIDRATALFAQQSLHVYRYQRPGRLLEMRNEARAVQNSQRHLTLDTQHSTLKSMACASDCAPPVVQN